MNKQTMIGIGFVAVIIALFIAIIAMIGVGSVPAEQEPVNPYPAGFDPREHAANVVYHTEDGTTIRGLMMTDETFDFMATGHDGFERQDMRKQVDAAEKNFTRQYTVYTMKTEYFIENGIVVGSQPHFD